MDTVLQPVFYELIAKTVQQLHVSRDKEGFLDLLLNLFRTIQVSRLAHPSRQEPNAAAGPKMLYLTHCRRMQCLTFHARVRMSS